MTDCKVCKSNPYYKRGWNCDSCQSRIDSVQTELASATWEGMGSVEREMWVGAAPLAAALFAAKKHKAKKDAEEWEVMEEEEEETAEETVA